MYCSICGSSLSVNDKFCGSCGSKVESTPTTETSPKGYTSDQPNEYIPVAANETKPWDDDPKPWQSPASSQSMQSSGAWSESYQPPMANTIGIASSDGKKRVSDPKEMYDEPNTLLKIIIILTWINFALMLIVAVVTATFIIPLIFTAPLTYLFYWLAKMLRRYHDGARITVVVLSALSILNAINILYVFDRIGWINIVIGIFNVYVLAFHEETKMQFKKYNSGATAPPQPMY